MSTFAERVVTTYLDNNNADLRLAKNLFRGPARPPAEGKIPAEAVFVQATGGFEPTACIDGGKGIYLLFCNLQIRVRSCANDYTGGLELAEEVHRLLQRMPCDFDCGVTGSTPRESCPVYLKRDDQERHEWIMNFELWIDQSVREECQ